MQYAFKQLQKLALLPGYIHVVTWKLSDCTPNYAVFSSLSYLTSSFRVKCLKGSWLCKRYQERRLAILLTINRFLNHLLRVYFNDFISWLCLQNCPLKFVGEKEWNQIQRLSLNIWSRTEPIPQLHVVFSVPIMHLWSSLHCSQQHTTRS